MALLCSELVRCKTADPPGDTREAMAVIERFMAEAGLPYKILGVNDTIPNIISSVRFSDKWRHLMFNGHLDTMPAGEEPGWTDDPWSGKIADGKVWGRGAGDMKGGVTAMLFAYKYVARLGEYLSGKVSLSLVSDEETGYGRGTGYLFEQIPDEMMADAVLSAEPSGIGAVSFASKGYVQFSVRVETQGAIAGYSNDSKSAVRIAADICSPLTEFAGMIQDAAEELNGHRPVMTPDIAISDCRYWRYRGIPAYWYGPDSFLCSAANENVSLDEIFHIAATHALTAVKFLLPKAGKRTRREVLCYPPESIGFSAEIKSLPSQYIAYTRHTARSFREKELTPIIERGLEELYSLLCAHDVTVGAVGMAIYEWKNNVFS